MRQQKRNEGTEVNYRALSQAVSNVRNCAGAECMQEALCDWDKEIKKDFKKRGKK